MTKEEYKEKKIEEWKELCEGNFYESEKFLSQTIDELWNKGSGITPLLEARKNITDRISDLDVDYIGAEKVLKEMNKQIELIDKNFEIIDKLKNGS